MTAVIDMTPFNETMIAIIMFGVLIITMEFIGMDRFANNLAVLIGSLLMIIMAFFVMTSLGYL